MSTSLSRQLEQLRTPSTAGGKAGPLSLFSSGPFLVEESDSLDERQLELLSLDAFSQLHEECPHIGSFRARIFEEDDNEDAGEEDVDWQEDLLMLLTPFALSRHAQFLLQWLVSKHRVHVTHPQSLIWCVMPYYEYKIFHRAVESVSVLPSAGYPQWFSAFKRACHPATQVGLHKHLACDRGFFKLLTDLILKTMAHQVRFKESNYDNVAYFYCFSVVSALTNCSAVSETQVYNLMQVIVAGLKTDHKEFRALGATLMARILPLVSLKSKVTNKLLKVLSKSCKKAKDESSFGLLLVLFRTQMETIDQEKVLALLAKHEEQALTIFRQADKDDDDLNFAKRVIHNLALMCNFVGNSTPVNEDALCVLNCVLEGVSRVTPSHDTVVLLITGVSKAFLQYKTLKRKAKKSEDSNQELLKKFSAISKQILASLKRAFPVDYLQHSAVQTEDIDIVFMGGNCDQPPTHEEITVKRILLDNPLVAFAKKDFLTSTSRKDRSREVKTMLKESASAIKILYSSTKPEFLLQQVELEELVKITLNLTRFYDKKSTVLCVILQFMCSEHFAGSRDVQQILEANNIHLELAILPLLIIHHEEAKGYLEVIRDSWYCKNVESVIQTVLKCRWKREDPVKDVCIQLWNKLVDSLSGDKLLAAVEKLLASEVAHSPELVAIFLSLLTSELSSAKAGKGASGQQTIKEVRALLAVIQVVRDKFDVANAEEEKKEAKSYDVAKVIYLAKTRKEIPIQLLIDAITSLKIAKDLNDEAILNEILYLACTMTKKEELLGQKLQELHATAAGTGEKLEQYLVDVCTKSLLKKGAGTGTVVTPAMQTHCMKSLVETLQSNKDAVKRFLSLKSYSLPRVLAALNGENNKQKKWAFNALKAGLAQGGPATNSYFSLVSYLLQNKTEILADGENIGRVMQSFMREEKGADLILRSLLASAVGSEVAFANLAVFLAPLQDKVDLGTLAQFGTKLLRAETTTARDSSIEALLLAVFPAMVTQMQDTKCWNFILVVLNSNTTVRFRNVSQKIPVSALRLIGSVTESTDAAKLFSALVDLSASCDDSEVLLECRNVIQNLPLTASMFGNKLSELWGEQLSVSESKRGKRLSRRIDLPPSVSGQGNETDAGSKLTKSIFLLEMFAAAGSNMKNSAATLLRPFFALLKQFCSSEQDTAYSVDLSLSCILQVVEQTSKSEMLQLDSNAVNPELLVQCINNCKNPDTKSTALLILAKASSACNAEYMLQNSIPIFTFMGDHFLKIESRHSFEVACQAIDIIIPHIQKVCQAKGEQVLEETNLNVVTTFVDASADMPTHRFKAFLHKLIVCLGERKHLWILTLLLLSTVGKKRRYIEGSQAKVSKVSKTEKLQQILDLYSAFTSRAQVEALLQMMVNLKQENSATVRKLLKMKNTESMMDDESDQSDDEFDLLRLKMLNFVTHLLGSKVFSGQILTSLEQGDDIKPQLQLLVECAILNISSYDKQCQKSKIRHHLVHHCEKILEGSLSILPTNVFVELLNSLLAHENNLVRRKSLEVFNAKLQLQDEALMAEETLTSLLEPIVLLAKGSMIGQEMGEETRFNQQLAMLALRSFARGFGAKYPGEFKQVCLQLTKKSFLKGLDNTNVVASALLCLTEIVQAIGPHAVSCLPSFVGWLLELLDDAAGEIKRNPILLNSLILAVQKLMENFSGFLNPYFKHFVISTCSLSSLQQKQKQQSSEQSRHMASRIKNLQSSMANGIPTHGLLAISRNCFDEAFADPHSVIALASILKENVSKLDKSQAVAISHSFMEFYMHAFKYRQNSHGVQELELINEVERAIIDAFMTLTLKLALDDFKPLFYRVFNLLAFDDACDVNICITVFHVTFEVAKKLKSLFEFICETLVQKATGVLNQCSKESFAKFINCGDDELSLQLIVFLLDTLATIFTYNRVEALLAKNYEDHVNALLTLFEYEFQSKQQTQLFFEKISHCLAQLATSTDDETQWKYLDYQVLLCLRSSSPQVRKCILNVITRFVEAKGENYMSVLPDAVPFLCEMMEDEDPELEAACKTLIKRMEEVFGQSVECYFE